MNFEIPSMIFLLCAFITLMLLVSRFALRPILAKMQERQDHIDQQIKTAEKSRQEAEKLMKEQKDALNRAYAQARDIVDQAKMQKEREIEEMMKEAQKNTDRMIQDATTQIHREKEKAMVSLRNEVGALTVFLASKILEKKINAKEQTQIIDRYVNQVGRLR